MSIVPPARVQLFMTVAIAAAPALQDTQSPVAAQYLNGEPSARQARRDPS
jgi:hypothetical protein